MNTAINQSAKTKSIKSVVLRATIAALVFATTFAFVDSTLAQGKRGLGGDNNPLITGINSNWYYRWALGINGDIEHAEFVPMFWSGASVSAANVQSVIDRSHSEFVLGFNEPERENQANMTVANALNRWRTLQPLRDNGFKLVSPAPSDTADGRAWLDEFMAAVDADPDLEVDEVAFHWYGTVNPNNPTGSANTFLNRVDFYHNRYGRPVWITEFAGLDFANDFDAETMQEANRVFLERVVPELERRAHVTRYAWWNHNNKSRLLTTDTSLPTVTGEAWIDTIVDGGEQFNIAGQNQGDDVFYLRGGELTNSGNSVPQAIRYVDAPEGDSVIGGTSDFGFRVGDPGYLLIRDDATLRKQGNNTITLPGTPITNEGALLIENGTLLLTDEAEISGQGTMLVDRNGVLATSTDAFDRAGGINLPAMAIDRGRLHIENGRATMAEELRLLNSSEIRSDGNLVISGSTTGTGSILSTGPGTLFLTGAGSHSSGVQVSAGSLIVANTDASATGSGMVSVSGSGLFGGFGQVAGSMFATANSTVAPGVSQNSAGATTALPSINEGVVVNAIDFDFTGVQDDAPLTQTSNLSTALQVVSGLDFGPGLNPRNAANAGNEFNVAGFTTADSFGESAAAGDYLTFTVAPVEGLAIQLQDATFEVRRNGTGAPQRFRMFNSINGFNSFADGRFFFTDDTNQATFTANFTNTVPSADPVEIRLYGWSASSAFGNLRVTNVSLDASFVSDPSSVSFDPTGVLELGGAYVQTSSATLEIDLGGTQAGEFDQLQVDGNVSLSGTLDISLVDGFEAAVGQTFDIITANSVTGAFDNVIVPEDVNVQVNYSDSMVSLVVTDDAILRGDVSRDQVVNFLDIAPFIALLSQGGFQEEADLSEDGAVNFLDIAPFIAVLSGQSF